MTIEIDYRMYSSDSIFFSYWNEAQIVKDNLSIENRIYREELKESLGMNFFSPFQP